MPGYGTFMPRFKEVGKEKIIDSRGVRLETHRTSRSQYSVLHYAPASTGISHRENPRYTVSPVDIYHRRQVASVRLLARLGFETRRRE